MNKVEQARDIFESANANATRMQIIAKIQLHTNSGAAYASTLYNKARKLSSPEPTKSGNKEAFVALGKKLAVDESKVAFIKNCHKVQGLKPGHYNHTFEYAHKSVYIAGVTKNGDLVCFKTGTKVRVNVDTRKAMEDLRNIKFFGKK